MKMASETKWKRKEGLGRRHGSAVAGGAALSLGLSQAGGVSSLQFIQTAFLLRRSAYRSRSCPSTGVNRLLSTALLSRRRLLTRFQAGAVFSPRHC